LALEIHFTHRPEDPVHQVVTFTPPVASWTFSEGHTPDELWKELLQASSALAHDFGDAPFAEREQAQMRERICSVVFYWEKQGWVTLYH
jgi:hypothetical protein